MKGIWATVSLFISQTSFGRLCKCLYGQLLIYPKPPAACYLAYGSSANCSDVLLNTTNGRWRSDQPGAMQNVNFETYIFPDGTISACHSNASLGFPCKQGSVSPLGVDARSVQDIQATVNFAVKHNLKLVVKNTGHDYLGRSAARGSLLLWTHLKNITYDSAFVPQGAPSTESYPAMIIKPSHSVPVFSGTRHAAQAQGRVVIGGLSAGGSVGSSGGWIAGGGHSALSPQHGLGADNAIQFTVVTSSGTFLTVNSHQHLDLFWALRGGGGGTYGVVTTVTYRTYPSVPLNVALLQVNFSTPQQSQDIVTEFVKTSLTLADANWGGYVYFDTASFQLAFVTPNISQENATAIMAPFFSFVSNVTHAVTKVIPFDSFYTAYQALFSGSGQVGTTAELSSRLIPRTVLEQTPDKVAETLLSLNGVMWNQVAGGAVSRVNPSSVGLNPAWREAITHVLTVGSWADGASSAEIDQVHDNLKTALQVLQSLAGPANGAYFNEASLYEPNPRQTFFGSHYSKLEKIKSAYDSHNLFIVAEGVGSENWDRNLQCLL